MSQITSGTRKDLIRCRAMAMLGQANVVLAELDAIFSSTNSRPIADKVAVCMLKAEILFLECREPEALAVFESEIEPRVSTMSQELRFMVSQNKRDVMLGGLLMTEGRQQDVLRDLQRIAGTKLWDASAVVRAYESSQADRHYEALPVLWKELLTSYHGAWLYHRQAARRLGREFILIGRAPTAVFYALIGLDAEAIKTIAECLLSWRKPEITNGVVQELMQHANLKRHATLACDLVERLSDLVADDQVVPITDWLLQRASVNPSMWSELNVVNKAWDALTALTSRFSPAMAKQVVSAATSHASWKQQDRVREHIVPTVAGCIHLLDPDDLPALAQQSIHLAEGMSEDININRDVVSLFEQIFQRTDRTTKELIRDAIFTKPEVNLALVSLAQEFGKTLDNGEQANKLAEYYAKDILLQVQHLTDDEEFQRPAISLGQVTIQGGGKSTCVSLYSDIGLRAVVANRQLLNENSIKVLIHSILEMLREPDNILANKVLMINGITGLADRLSNEQAEEIFETLKPMASGEVSSLKQMGDPNDPLNPFKVKLGEPSTVQGGALVALATIEFHHPSLYGDRVIALIEEGMTNPNAEVRTLAFFAARQLPGVRDSTLPIAFLATRDAVPTVAVEAFLVLNSHKRDTPEFWVSIISALKTAIQSPDTSVRQVAAFTVRELASKVTRHDLAKQLSELRMLLESDISSAVRKKAESKAVPEDSETSAT